MLIGTGGTVRSSEAKDVFLMPNAYKLYPCNVEGSDKPTGLFIPTYYKYGGFYEKTGYPDYEGAKAKLDEERKLKQEDPIMYAKYCQEFPYTVKEVFKQKGTNIFNQDKISKQRALLDFSKNIIKPERGRFEWKRSVSGKIIGVEFIKSNIGDVYIVEHPERDQNKKLYKDLYVIGCDSIDMGSADSTTENGSKLAALCKKRISPNYSSAPSQLYACMYNKRSEDVNDDYEVVLQMSIYYNAPVNIEYTRIGIVSYFNTQKQKHRLMKRVSMATFSQASQKKRDLIGVQATAVVIDHQDALLKQYIDEYCHQIYFPELLEQLQEYQRENRTKYDLEIAAGLCELADEDKTGIIAKPQGERASDGLKLFGYYLDEKGRKRYGVIPDSNKNKAIPKKERTYGDIRWIDSDGTLHFDENV